MLRLFEIPLNVGRNRNTNGSNTVITSITDNNYESHTTETTVKCHIDASGDGTGVMRSYTHIFIKCVNLTSWTLNGGASITVPSTVTDDSDNSNSIIVDNKQNILHAITGTDDTLTFVFSGSGVKIYELYVLNKHIDIDEDEYAGLLRDEDNKNPSSRVVQTPIENKSVPNLGKPRNKRIKDYTVRAINNSTLINDLELFYDKHQNLTIAAEYERFPDRVFMGCFDGELKTEWLNPSKPAGRKSTFKIRER